jgi:Flp pilus assembly protein TadG
MFSVNCNEHDRGVSLVFVAISAFLLMGLAALALDGGRLYVERRSAQNAADQAVVAAAHAECTGLTPAQAISAGESAADANGFDNNGTTNTVQVVQLSQYQYRATVDSTIDGTFSAVIGADTLTAAATAVASCTPGSIQGEALFANATSCSPELRIQGNTLTVVGGAHTNGDVTISGENHDMGGGMTHVGTFTDTGSTNTYTPAPATGTVRPYPIDFQIAAYQAGGAVATEAAGQYFNVSMTVPSGTTYSGGLWRVGDGATLQPGVYYSPGRIEVGNNVNVASASGGLIDGITFVALGKITFKDNANFTAWGGSTNQDLIVFSNHPDPSTCGTLAVELMGNTNVFNGIILAKNGVASIKGNAASAFGGVWGNQVTIQANSFGVNGPTIGSGGDPTVTFDE